MTGMIGFEILNLEHRTDRKQVCVGNLLTQMVPEKSINFFPGVNGADYPNAEAVCEDAVRDGFPTFEKDCEMGGRGDVAYHWGVMKILRRIASPSYPFEFGYFNQDDRLLPHSVTYYDLCEMANILDNRPPDFLFLQMAWFLSPEDVPILKVEPENLFYDIKSRIYTHFCAGVGDSGLLISPAGARYLIEAFSRTKMWFEKLIYFEGQREGCYSLFNSFHCQINTVFMSNTEQDRIVNNAV